MNHLFDNYDDPDEDDALYEPNFDDEDDDERIARQLLAGADLSELDHYDLPPGYHIESEDAPFFDDEEIELLEIESADWQETLAALPDPAYLLTPAYLRALSDLHTEQIEQLRNLWPTIAPDRRVAIVEHIFELSTIDWAVDGLTVATIALADDLGTVRATALDILAEDCPPRLAHQIITLFQTDPDPRVRASAASVLGQFIYHALMDELPEAQAAPVETALLTALRAEPPIPIRRRIIEAIGYIDRPDVQAHIQTAYDHGDPDLRASAMRAMGNSLNADRWQATVLAELNTATTTPSVGFQAIYAAGELQLTAALDPLLLLLTTNDTELRDGAIWALSEIGGRRARRGLTALAEARPDDAELQALIDEALANMELSSQIHYRDN